MLKKIASILLICALTVSGLVSCRKKTEESGTAPHIITVSIDFSCDEELTALFDQLEKEKTVVYVDGDKYKVDSQIEIEADSTNFYKDVFTVIDGTVYEHYRYYLNGVLHNDEKVKAPITDEESNDFLHRSCRIGGISVDRFASSTEENRDGKNVTVYTGPSKEDCIVLERTLISVLEGVCDLVAVTSATVTVEMTDGRYTKAVAECHYKLTLYGEEYSVSSTVTLDYDYDTDFEILVPDDDINYAYVEIEEIIE